MKNKWCFVLILGFSLFFVSCTYEDLEIETEQTVSNQYLTRVVSEKKFDKKDIAFLLSEYAARQGLVIPDWLITGLLCDVDVAILEYNTIGVDGKPVVASGVIALPSGTKSYDHLLSIQHSTLDLEEAPSRQQFYYEMLPVIKGHIVVLADYLGYGSSQTSDRRHPYLHARLTGSACADMIAASREYLHFKSVEEIGADIDLLGYSQGGQATMATLFELEHRGQSVRNVYAGGGLYDLELVIQSILKQTTSYSYTGYLPWLIRGMEYGEQLDLRDEDLYASEVFEKGLNMMFTTTPLSQWHAALGTDIHRVLHSDFFAYPTCNGNTAVLAVLEALRENSLVAGTPQTFVHLFHSRHDEVVPYANAESAHRAWPNSILIDLEMSGHVLSGIEFMLRYMNLWDIWGEFLK